ncbi:MAG: hypothetical protein KDD38_05840 [Bdellovibrionales bacterium]|nr:hypothetical protein [Bdellovibrionales bacterium]
MLREIRNINSYGASVLILSLFTFFVVSCAQKPTKIYQSYDVNTNVLQTKLAKPIRVTDSTVIIDARAPFEYAMSHLPQAVNLQWSDFADTRGPYKGRLKSDLTDSLRRLSLLGISPQSEVVILGSGLKGRGEEGRLAWTLLYLGVENIQIAEGDSLGLRYSNIVPPPRVNAKSWEPKLRLSILADKKEVKKIATSPQDGRTHILDVRSKNEYFSKTRKLEYEYPDLRATHIEWTEFYTPDGRPNLSIREQLSAVHIRPTDRIVVISNNGVRSGAVSYALLALGYKNTANYPGGYAELLDLKAN